MKNIKTIFLLTIFFLASGCSGEVEHTPVPTTAIEETTQTSYTSHADIHANGVLFPIRQMELSFGTGGLIETVNVEVGEVVDTGQVLVRLDTTEAQFALQLAEAELAAAQANYDLVAAGKPEEKQAAVAAAKLALIAAQLERKTIDQDAELAAAQAHQTMIEAQINVDDTERYLNNLTANANQAHIDAAYANMILAQAALEKAEEDYEPWRNKPENNTTRATMLSKLAQAQQLYDATVRRYNGFTGNANDIDLAQAEVDHALALAKLVTAQDNYEILKNGPDPDEITLAEAKIVNAQARLALAENAEPTAEQLTQAQAQVEMAQTHLDRIKSQIDKMIITAPFDGVISRVPAKQGEWAIPGEIMIELMDTSGWKIETKNVGELQIGRIEIGQAVKVTVNAFKDEELRGQVFAISPIAVVQQGDTTYTLLIELESTDLELWPGMTTQVEIIIESD
jgi:HlyD family secretion protein